jgi:hypothetical protein
MAAARRYGQDVDKPKPRNDAYTGLLGISFVAMLIGCLLLFLDWNSYDSAKPPDVMKNLPKLKAVNVPPAGPREVAQPKVEDKKPEAKKVEEKKMEEKKMEPKKDDAKKKAEEKKKDGK